eukprot:4848875-Lingulodinium_polyedra.AAC.1
MGGGEFSHAGTRAPFPLRSPRPPSLRVHPWSRRLSPTQTLLYWAAPVPRWEWVASPGTAP